MKKLILTDSPNAAAIVEHVLGNDCIAISMMEHLLMLPKGPQIYNNLDNYCAALIPVPGMEVHISRLRELLAQIRTVYIATTPNIEGDIIAWEIRSYFGLADSRIFRVKFHELTPDGIRRGMENPDKPDVELVKARFCRLIAGLAVERTLNPIFWKSMRGGISGAFLPLAAAAATQQQERSSMGLQEEWRLEAVSESSNNSLRFEVTSQNGEPAILDNKNAAQALADKLMENGITELTHSVECMCLPPPGPLTSTELCCIAESLYNITPRTVLGSLQSLFDGTVKRGSVEHGWISSMHSFSPELERKAEERAREYISKRYGESYLAPSLTIANNESNSHHSASIYPCFPDVEPDSLKKLVFQRQKVLYELIWKHYIMSKMSMAEINRHTFTFVSCGYLFRGSYDETLFDGWIRILSGENNEAKCMPFSVSGFDSASLNVIPRCIPVAGKYTASSFIASESAKALFPPGEAARALSAAIYYRYIYASAGSIELTPLGKAVLDVAEVVLNTNDIYEYLKDFNSRFDIRSFDTEELKDRMYEFITNLKETSLSPEKAEAAITVSLQEKNSGCSCQICGAPMAIRFGKYGEFLACTNYPACKTTKTIEAPTSGRCPKCDSLIMKRSGKDNAIYYSCIETCGFITDNIPTAVACPCCGKSLFKRPGRGNRKRFCMNPDCQGMEKERNH